MIRKQPRRLLTFAAAASVLAGLPSAGLASPTKGEPPVSARDAVTEGPATSEISEVLRRTVHDASQHSPTRSQARERFAADAAYTRQGFRPLWTRASAAMLRQAYAGAYPLGADIPADQVEALDAIIETRFETTSPIEAVRADRAITQAWFALTRRVASATNRQAPQVSELSAGLSQAADGDIEASLNHFEPAHPQYEGLKSALVRYRDLARKGGWYAVRNGDLVRPGQSDPRIANLRRRLDAEGYLSKPGGSGPLGGIDAMPVSDTDSTAPYDRSIADANMPADTSAAAQLTLDRSLEAALRRFQQDHGLEVDGVLGPKTINALNESPESKIRRIVDSMARWRDFGPTENRYIWVNVPSYTAEGWNGHERQISMKAIVGRPDRPTPIFSDEIEYTVTNPKWFVPISIARRDKLPKLRRDPGYAIRENIRVYERATGREVVPATVDWGDPASARRYRLVQSPGPQNALGQLKIIFPNEHSVYLHGTPAKQLFSHARRAFSSGCIRLNAPVAMARWLASDDDGLSPDTIDRALQAGKRQHLRYARRTPVHVTYMTVTVGTDGRPAFWRDIYARTAPSERVARHYPGVTESAQAGTAPAPNLLAANHPR